VQLVIDKLVYGGDGLARESSGRAVLLPFVLPGERVKAEIVEAKRGFARARVDQVLQPSVERVPAQCPYFGACGGCQYQHARYEYQLRTKADIVRETLQRIGRIAVPDLQVHASPPWHYRNRTRMKVRQQREFALGYFHRHSNRLLPVEECPISSPLINRAIQAVWKLGRTRLVPDSVAEIEFFANADDSLLLAGPILAQAAPSGPPGAGRRPAAFASALRREMPEVAGVALLRGTTAGQLAREEVPAGLGDNFGGGELVCHAGGFAYHVSAGSFFQANHHLTGKMIELVTAGHTGSTALDLYAGTGLFTLPLAQNFPNVVAVEAAPGSFHDLERNCPPQVRAVRETAEHNEQQATSCQLQARSVRTLRESAESFFRQQDGKAAVDFVVADPPRAGLGPEVSAGLAALPTPAVTYVSCDPATLARDLKALLAGGFHIAGMHLLDMFPQTAHIECVARLER
jgi:23S rRNA (uracil1939-C5)-methyltransferase